MKKAIFITIGAIVLIGALVAVLQFSPTQNTNQTVASGDDTSPVEQPSDDMPATPDISPTPTSTPDPETSAPEPPAATASAGRYADYSQAAVAASGYNETILFFHASWCPECRAFEQAITGSDITDGVQILKVDYDSSSDLRQRYGVTIQSTFVKVNASGDEVSQWVGYGRDKSLSIVLENT